MPEALKTNPAPSEFLRLPIWISSGINDRIATPAQERQVKGSLARTGFQNVRLSRFRGSHEVNRADLQSALKWFREREHFCLGDPSFARISWGHAAKNTGGLIALTRRS